MRRPTSLLAATGIALALAGCQSVASSTGDYKFVQVGNHTIADGETAIAVRLVHVDESPVPGAQFYAVQWTHVGPKTPPGQQLTPLPADASGNFVYRASDLDDGDTIRLAARVAPDSTPIFGSIEVH